MTFVTMTSTRRCGRSRHAQAWVVAAGLTLGGCESDAPSFGPETTHAAGTSDGDETGTDASLVLEVESVQYVIDWVTPGPVAGDGAAFDVVTNLGYEVAVDQAWLTTRGMTLIACDSDGEAPQLNAPDAGLDLEGRWSPRSDGAQSDPTSVYHGYVEDLSARVPAEFGSRSFDRMRSCGMHFVLGQAPATALNLPLEPEMLATTLLVSGRFRGPDADAWTSFSIDVDHADGLITGWHASEVAPDASSGAALRVTVARDLGQAFDDIDFDTATQMELDITVLHNLATTATIRVAAAI